MKDTNFLKLFKTILPFASLFGVLRFAQPAFGQESVCTQVYGGGVVCGAALPPIEHKPVSAGLGDLNPVLLGSILILFSLSVLFFAKRGQKGKAYLFKK